MLCVFYVLYHCLVFIEIHRRNFLPLFNVGIVLYLHFQVFFSHFEHNHGCGWFQVWRPRLWIVTNALVAMGDHFRINPLRGLE